MIRLFTAILLLIGLSGAATAQPYPDYQSLYVNDYAEVITPDAEARLTGALKSLRDENGIEMTVLTIRSRAAFGDSPSIESFATGLFNTWGIGNADRNDGILVLVAVDDREMRIELGSGFGTDFNRAAQEVIDFEFLPLFKDGQYSEGIETGTMATITRIAKRFGSEPEFRTKSPTDYIDVIVIAVFGLIAGLVVFRRKIADGFKRFSTCPTCGHRGLKVRRKTTKRATRTAAGSAEKTVYCPNCDYSNTSYIHLSRISSSSSGSSFGGGSSSGGGASGRW